MIKYSKIFFSFLVLLIFSLQLHAQSLTVQTLAGTTDAILGPDNFTSYKGLVIDIHDKTGIRVYSWVVSDDPTNTNGHQADHDVYCRIFDKDMNPMTPEFRVNKNINADQQYPAVRIDQKSSYFVIAWGSNHGVDNYDIYAKKMDLYMSNSSDVINQNDFLVNENGHLSPLPYPYTGSQITPYLAFDYNYNELIVAYRDQDGHDNYPATTGASGVYARRINWQNFTLVNEVFQVNSTVIDHQIIQDVEVSPVTGELMVAYQTISSGSYDVILRKFTRTSTGDWTPQAEIPINYTTASNQDGPQIIINSTTGDYVVAWKSTSQDGSGNGCYMRPFTKFGQDITVPTPWLHQEMRINVPTVNNQQYPQGVWDEKSNNLIFFYLYTAGTTAYYKYQLINATTLTAINGEMPACSTSTGEINTLFLSGAPKVAYSKTKQQVTLAYQIWNVNSGSPAYSKARSRSYAYASLIPDNNTDLNKNWVQQTTYNESGVIVSETRAYSDQLGRSTQTQVRNIEDANIIAATNVFDTYGRAAIQTLPAPINSQSFTFKTDLITTNTGFNYDYNYFDKPNTVAAAQGEINNPVGVSHSTGVGAYYNGLNFVASSSYPYTRVDYNDKVAGGLVRSANVGDDLVMGSNKEVKTIVLPLLNELDHYRNTVTGSSPNLAFKGTKQVSIDENGIASIAFMDQEGNLLAKALAGGTRACTSSVTLGETFFYQNISTGTTDNIGEMRVYGADAIEIYDVTGGTYTLLASLPQKLASSKTLQIRSKSGFDVYWNSYNNSDPRTATPLVASGVDINAGNTFSVTSSVDFYLKDLPSLSLTSSNASSLNIKILDLTSGNIVYTGLLSAFTNTLTEGFYRLSVEKPPVATSYTSYSLTFAYNFFYSDFSYNFYDLKGRMIAEVAPKGIDFSNTSTVPNFTNTKKYNTLSLVISKTETDAGITNYVYRKDGKIRFSQNAKQATSGKFSYANYDVAGRPVESGEYNNSAGTLVFQTYSAYDATPNSNSVFTVMENISNAGGLGSTCTCRTDITSTAYDIPDPSIPGTPTLPAARTQRFLTGRISYSFNANSTTWYSYDELERLEWTIQNIAGLGYKTTDYKYDLNGNVLNVIYQDATTERFEHRYTYDGNQKLKMVETKPGTNSFQTEASYFYYLHGPLKRIELANQLQGIDYVYTIQGWLKSINNPSLDNLDPGADGITGSSHAAFGQDVFGMLLEYFSTDMHSLGDYAYQSGCDYGLNNSRITTTGVTDYYDGTVKAMRWQTKGYPFAGGMPQYVYQYDNKYQLTNATFGTVARGTFSCGGTVSSNPYYVFTANNNFKVSNLNYDLNGNILNKYSTNDLGATLDKFDYNLTANTNKLSSVQNNGSSPVTYYSQYQYDAIGQMTQEISGGFTKNLTYNVYKKVTNVAKSTGANLVDFVYNELGHRIKKTTYTTAGAVSYNTYYVNDASGNPLSIYDDRSGTLAQTELPVYGTSRLGVAYKSTSTYVYEYELTDHLGNVRATISRTKNTSNQAVIINMQDYFPHGQIMTNRQITGRSSSFKTDYQGQNSEKDIETGYNSFQARMYDSRIGRWISCDPDGQYYSPYLGMGNNPINCIDKDGKWVHVLAFALGAGLTAGNMYVNGEFENGITWSQGSRIALGGLTGLAMVSMVPALPALGITINTIGVVAANATLAGTIGAASSIMDAGIQGKDITSREVLKGAALSGALSAGSYGLGGYYGTKWIQQANSASYKFMSYLYRQELGVTKGTSDFARKFPGLFAATINAGFDIASSGIQSFSDYLSPAPSSYAQASTYFMEPSYNPSSSLKGGSPIDFEEPSNSSNFSVIIYVEQYDSPESGGWQNSVDEQIGGQNVGGGQNEGGGGGSEPEGEE